MNFLDSSPKKYKILGNPNFSVDVSVQGQLPHHTAVISLITCPKSNRKDIIGSNYKWFRMTEQSVFQLTDMVSNTYMLSPADIGYKLKVEITPKEEGYGGVATVEFGVIKLDPSTKNILEGILTVGGSNFPATSIQENSNKMNSDYNILLTNDVIRIVRNFDQESLKFGYSLENPRVDINSRDLTQISFYFPGSFIEKNRILDENKKIHFRLTSRNSRDLLLLSIKCFAIKNFLINSKIINSLEDCVNNNSGKTGKENEINQNHLKIDLYLDMNILKEENSMLLDKINLIKKERDNFSDQVKNLEEEIVETIDTYTKLIADIKENPENGDENFNLEKKKNEFMTLRSKKSEVLDAELLNIKKTLFKDDFESQVHELQAKNTNLIMEINSLKSELLNYKFLKPENNANLQDFQIKNEILTQENISLKQTQQKYFELLSRYRELDEKYSNVTKNKNLNMPFNDNKIDLLQKELAIEKENNQKLNDNLKLLTVQFNSLRNKSSNNIDSESLIATNKQLNKKIESLQKEVESKGDSLMIEHLSKTNAKFLDENQKLIEELKRKNDELSLLRARGNKNGNLDLIDENRSLKERIYGLEVEKDKLLVQVSKQKK